MRPAAASTEYVLVPISEQIGGTVVDLTVFPVAVALVLDGTSPATSDWHTADWEVNAVTGDQQARLLVGPAGVVTLSAGKAYRPWVKVTASPQVYVSEAPGLVRPY